MAAAADVHIRVFGKNIVVTNQSGEMAMAVDIHHMPLIKIWAQFEPNPHLAGDLKLYKGFPKLYIGNYGQIFIWP